MSMYPTDLTRPPSPPRWLQWLARRVIQLLGFRLEGAPPNLEKFVMIGAPHTDNIDVPIMVLMATAVGLRIRFLFKEDFRPPMRWILMAMGGIPVNSSQIKKNSVQQVVDAFDSNDKLVLMIAPEGRLKRVPFWRSGFYHIALGANVPVVPGSLDYARKLIRVGEPYLLTGDVEADMDVFRAFYDGVVARHPEKVGPIALRAEDGSVNFMAHRGAYHQERQRQSSGGGGAR